MIQALRPQPGFEPVTILKVTGEQRVEAIDRVGEFQLITHTQIGNGHHRLAQPAQQTLPLQPILAPQHLETAASSKQINHLAIAVQAGEVHRRSPQRRLPLKPKCAQELQTLRRIHSDPAAKIEMGALGVMPHLQIFQARA
nr:hypothetical protein [Sphingomonas sp.]